MKLPKIRKSTSLNKRKNNLSSEIKNLYEKLVEKVKNYETFSLLSNIAFYNHIHESDEYKDFRGDKNFFVSEVVALVCLKNDYVDINTIEQEKFVDGLKEIQDITLSYCSKKLDYDSPENTSNNIISLMSDSLKRESLNIRNPGLPEHHLLFSEELYCPIENEMLQVFNFSISDSIKIRESITKLINKKINDALKEINKQVNLHSTEIINFRKTKVHKKDSVFTLEELNEYILLSNEEINNGLNNFQLNEFSYNLSDFITFSEVELSTFSKIELSKVKSFLKLFSCNFPSLQNEDEVYTPVSILKTKPILHNNNKYLVPSLPLLIWAVEDVIETEIKQKPKLNKRFPNIKHDFLLEKGISYLSKILPSAIIFPPNLFYKENENRYETDGLIIYDKTLFIIEAKGNRITTKAKKGHQLKLKDHIEDIVKDSYKQGLRTIEYLEKKGKVTFETKQGEKIPIDKKDFNEVVLVSLILEPIGHLSMEIKATNEIGYFNDKHFPWIISLYDLVIIADLFETPFLLILYLKRRKKFLEYDNLNIYEELDLVGYFLKNGLQIDNTIKELNSGEVNFVYFANETDFINDYYMFHFGKKETFTPKPKSYLSRECVDFLNQLDKSKLEHRVRMALILLSFNNKSIKDFLAQVKKNKKAFSKDRLLHDGSIYSIENGGTGITFMIAEEKKYLDYKLYQYCQYKQYELNTNIWIGFGDISKDKRKYNFKSMFIKIRSNPEE